VVKAVNSKVLVFTNVLPFLAPGGSPIAHVGQTGSVETFVINLTGQQSFYMVEVKWVPACGASMIIGNTFKALEANGYEEINPISFVVPPLDPCNTAKTAVVRTTAKALVVGGAPSIEAVRDSGVIKIP